MTVGVVALVAAVVEPDSLLAQPFAGLPLVADDDYSKLCSFQVQSENGLSYEKSLQFHSVTLLIAQWVDLKVEKTTH